jgi:hypothetical protein
MGSMFPRFLLLGVLLLWTVSVSPAQEPQKTSGPRIELLTMNGGKPNLSATGEGIASYKNDEIYQRGKMTVRLLKPEERKLFTLELPLGYSLFNDLIYVVETDISFAGLSDITFNIPSARTKETFAQLRILFPEIDYSDPKVPRWNDITLDGDSEEAQRWLSETAIKQRLPDFKSRTLHGFIQYSPVVFLVALRDPTKVRNNLTADLQLTGSVQEQVTEGQRVTYELKITNAGPDMATGIRLHSERGFAFVSIDTSEGKCNLMGGNGNCKIPSLEKGRSVDIKIIEQCEWGPHYDLPPGADAPGASQVTKFITVGATERDPSFENNQLHLTTQVFPDQNKGPVIEIVSPTLSQLFAGPGASVPIRFKASDPDGFIKKVELFDTENGKSLGEATLQSEGQYELIYRDVGLGNRSVAIVATDNLGRVASEQTPQFFVNGPAKVEITSPKAGSVLNRADGEITITMHASSPSSSIKKVSLDFWESDARAIGNDTYVVKMKSCMRKCRLQAIATDDKGIESRSEYVEFTVASNPMAKLYWYDGEYLQEFEPGKPLKVSNELTLHASGVHEESFNEADIVKTEIFVDNVLVCTIDETNRYWHEYNCVWRPSPGKYKLHAVTRDEDGAVGKSEVIEVVIERP